MIAPENKNEVEFSQKRFPVRRQSDWRYAHSFELSAMMDNGMECSMGFKFTTESPCENTDEYVACYADYRGRAETAILEAMKAYRGIA